MISVESLSFHFGACKALDQVSFEVRRGEILGLLGPNGAGKTTLMRVLTTFLYPTQGRARVAGFDVAREPLEVRRRTGYLPESIPLYGEMRVDEYLFFVARAHGLSPPNDEARLHWVRQTCRLEPVWKHALFEISKGYQERVGLAQALIHDPEVLILDEPTSGLDPLQIIEIRRLIRDLAREKTVIFSTHILQEVEALADRIVILNEGTIIAEGTRESLVRTSAPAPRVRLGVHAQSEHEILNALEESRLFDSVLYEGSPGKDLHRFIILGRSGTRPLESLEGFSRERNWGVYHLEEESPSLEEVFISLLRGKGRR